LTHLQDLTTYRIQALVPSLELKEQFVGDGDLCGSAMLNLRFEEFLRAKLGQEILKEDMNDVSWLSMDAKRNS
jgi:hypothetical protein